MRIGIGRDLHRLERGRRLVLGGVVVSECVGCIAHSDGDCLVHGVIDAMLGAMAMPNIGVLFPDSCEKNRGRSSLSMLVEVAEIVAAKGYVLSNADAVIMLEQPKLSPFVGAMRHAIARSCGVGEGSIGIKATTAEGLGHIGESMAIEVVCVCLLKTLVLK